jgi:hypothetical protein
MKEKGLQEKGMKERGKKERWVEVKKKKIN